MSIKEYILNNFKNDSKDDILGAINESISSKDEVTLPGLGVFFTIVWENASEGMKNQIVEMIELNMKGN